MYVVLCSLVSNLYGAVTTRQGHLYTVLARQGPGVGEMCLLSDVAQHNTQAGDGRGGGSVGMTIKMGEALTDGSGGDIIERKGVPGGSLTVGTQPAWLRLTPDRHCCLYVSRWLSPLFSYVPCW